jgi:lipoate-protein ligase A
MAVDEAMLILASEGACPPTLRFFSWEVTSLSIGSFQDIKELDMDRLKPCGMPLVRRPTGGRAVLHGSELTYSVTCPIPSRFFPSDLMGSYKAIGSCFLEGLTGLGIDAALVPAAKNPDRKRRECAGRDPLCFSSPSWHEVLAGGKKLIGSAQRRLAGSFLQQGSLLVKLDIDGLISMMRFKDDGQRNAARDALASKMTALDEHASGVDMDSLKRAVVAGFEDVLGADVSPGTLTERETELARRLASEKYATDGWNLNRSKV